MFLTDAIMSGLPPHIAQMIAGHRDINVTLGYKAVYPDEAIQAHLAFLARRRALRPDVAHHGCHATRAEADRDAPRQGGRATRWTGCGTGPEDARPAGCGSGRRVAAKARLPAGRGDLLGRPARPADLAVRG